MGQPASRTSHADRPTKVGDVLILRSRETFTVYVVGVVSAVGQEDFSQAPNVVVARTNAEAITMARARVAPDRKIYLFDIGTDEWTEV